MNTQNILRYFHQHVHGDAQQKQEAEAMLLLFEEEARRDAEAEEKWADERDDGSLMATLRKFKALPEDILHNK